MPGIRVSCASEPGGDPPFAAIRPPCYRPAMIKQVLRHDWVVAGGVWAGTVALRGVLRSTAWTLEGLPPAFQDASPAIFAFWHERLPLMPALWTHALAARRAQGSAPGRMAVLVSRNHDGRLIGQVMRAFGVDLAYGSSAKGGSQKGGSAALRALLAVLAGGGQVVITPDGPRGPRRVAHPGVAQLAALAGVPVIPCGAQVTRRRTLSSWDRMVLPLPFGRGAIVCGAPIAVPRMGWAATLSGIAQALDTAADRADALCR